MKRTFKTRSFAGWGPGKALLCVLVVASGLLMLAGCGSSDSSSDSSGASTDNSTEAGTGGGSSEAAAVIAEAEKPITGWDGFGSPFKPPSGKKITLIECSSLGTGCVLTAEAAQDAAKEIGWESTIVNGKGDPTVWNAAIKNAVATNSDGIILFAISPEVIPDGIAAAEAAGIPVVSALIGPKPKGGAQTITDLSNTAERFAAVVAVNNEDGKTLILDAPEFQFIHEENEVLVEDLEGFCPSCESEVKAFDFATMATKLSSQVASEVRADPSISLIVAPFGAAVPFVRQGLQQIGSDAQIITEGETEVLESTGDGVQLATIASSADWMGWESLDDLARLVTGEPVKETPLQTRLFTAENNDDIAAFLASEEFDFKAEYRKLWGK